MAFIWYGESAITSLRPTYLHQNNLLIASASNRDTRLRSCKRARKHGDEWRYKSADCSRAESQTRAFRDSRGIEASQRVSGIPSPSSEGENFRADGNGRKSDARKGARFRFRREEGNRGYRYAENRGEHFRLVEEAKVR